MVPAAPTVLVIAVEAIVAACLPVTEKVTGMVTAVPTGVINDSCGVDTAISGGGVVELVKFMLQSSGPRTDMLGLPRPVTML